MGAVVENSLLQVREKSYVRTRAWELSVACKPSLLQVLSYGNKHKATQTVGHKTLLQALKFKRRHRMMQDGVLWVPQRRPSFLW